MILMLLYIDAMNARLDGFTENFKVVAEGVVEKIDTDKKIAIIKVGRCLKGTTAYTHLRLNVGAGPGWHPEAVMPHFTPGAKVALWWYWGAGPKGAVYINRFFLEFWRNGDDPEKPWWFLNALATLYNGPVEELLPLLEGLLAKKAQAPRVDEKLPPLTRESLAALRLETDARERDYALRFSGYLEVPRAGVYTFTLVSNDGAALRIGDAKVVDNDHHQGVVETRGEIALKPGKHALRLDYFQGSGFQVLEALWEGPELPKAPIPASALFREAK